MTSIREIKTAAYPADDRIERQESGEKESVDIAKLRDELVNKGKFLKMLENKGIPFENAGEIQAKIDSALGFLNNLLDEEQS